MKKFLSAILALTTLLSCFVISVSAETASITDNLVVAYDFEGNTQAYQLSDKATAGNVSDDLTITGDVTITNGVATVSNDTVTNSKLNAKTTEELKNLSGYTIYLKVKTASNASTSFADFINIPGLARVYVTGDGTNYTLNGKHGNVGMFGYKNNKAMTSDTWLYIALTAEVDTVNDKLKLYTYTSSDGVAYAQSNVAQPAYTSADTVSMTSTINIADSTQGMVYSYDDIMIFNKALSADEVKEISTIKFDIKSNLVTAYDFEGTTSDKQFADKAIAGSVTDNLTITGNVIVQNGVATVAADTDTMASKLNAKNTADLKNLSEYTMYLKVKATGEATNTLSDFINIPGLGRAYTNGSGTNYTLGGQQSSLGYSYFNNKAMVADEWLYIALAVELDADSDKLKMYTFTSADGKAYSSKMVERDLSSVDVLSMTSTINIADSSRGMTYSYDDIMIFNKALSAGEVAELSSVKVSQDRLGFVGYQTGNKTATSYDIRFVSVIDSLNYASVGYDVVVTKNGVEQGKVTHYCETVYGAIYEMNYEKTSAQLGGKYIFAFGIRGFNIMDGEVVFTVTSFYYDGKTKVPLTTVEITNPHSETSTCKFVY